MGSRSVRFVLMPMVSGLALVAGLTAHYAGRLLPLDKAALASVWGGDQCCTQSPNNCIRTETTCPDPTYSNCIQVPGSTFCQQCVMSVPNWKDCVTSKVNTLTCCVQSKVTDPWCGKYQTIGFFMCKCSGACNQPTTRNCGMQIAGCIQGQNCRKDSPNAFQIAENTGSLHPDQALDE